MKKLFLTLALIVMLVFAVTACYGNGGGDKPIDPSDPEHVHSYGEWVTTKEASCTEAGSKERVCSCLEKETETIPAKGHSFGEWTTTLEPTCTEDGTKERVCACGEKESETITAPGHTFGGWVIDEAATCQKTGIRHHICTVCNKSVSETYSDASAHNYTTWASDNTHHWRKCQNSGCNFVGDKASHNMIDGWCKACNYGPYIRDGNYIYFGEYPQTLKADSVTITSSQDDRGYYLGSDGFYYAKVTADPWGSNYTFSSGTTVKYGTVYYFKVEPIRWRILSESCDTALILCDSIIANKCFDDSSNNYADSDIRAWLNDQFYNTAFNALQKDFINTVLVNNSRTSTRHPLNLYACANTNDKIFLLSYKEAITFDYGFASSITGDSARRMTVSDYARATGAYVSTSYGAWWLRSPYYNPDHQYIDNYMCHVDDDGLTDDRVFCSIYSGNVGVVPALQIKLTAAHNYATAWTSDGTNHWHKCLNSGCTSVVDKTAHVFGEWIVDTAATCQKTGTRHHVCNVCNKSVSESYSDANAHNYTATWTTDNTHHWHKCQNAGCTSVKDKTTHTFGEWIVDTAATCQKTGTRHHVCTVCNKSVSESYSDPSAHNYATTWTTDGTNHWHVCQNSGCTSVSGKASHTWDKENTCVCQRYKDSGVKFTKLSDGTYQISGYTGSASEVIIPSAYNGIAVTSIGSSAFYGCNGLTSVTFGDNSKLTSIGDGAFEYCTSLTSITIPDSVTSIGNRAFRDCSSLTSITIPDSVTSIGDDAFYNCTGLTSIRFGEDSKLTSIGDETFYHCISLTSITFGNNSQLTSIGERAFASCDSLTSITIPDGVTSIGWHAFYNCKSLTSISFGENSKLTSIGDGAFEYCTSLTSITIPDSVTSIGEGAFYKCTSLTSIHFGENSKLTSIGSKAFYNCNSLTSITIPGSVTSIGSGALAGIELWNITLEQGNTSYHIAGNCLIETKSKTLVRGCDSSVIPTDGSVTSIDGYAFYGCTGLTSITIPDGVTSIGNAAFYNCKSLTSITIPDGVTSIGGSAFEYCTSLTSITIPDSVTSIGSYAFSNTGYYTNGSNWENSVLYIGKHLIKAKTSPSGSYAIKEGTICIGSYAFRDCTSLTSITIPDSVTSIGSYAFYECSSLTSITIPDSVTSIGYEAFYNCSSLTSIRFGENSKLTSIGERAFYQCTRLTSITIPSSVVQVGDYAFASCRGLKTVTFAENSQLVGIGEYAFYYCDSLTSISFGENSKLTSIGEYAFEDCTSLKSINFGENSKLTSIGERAFYNCTSLTSITIPDSVTSIGEYAFRDCSSLTSISFGENSKLTSIGGYAFYECTRLTSITIPDSVTSIGSYAFYECSSLTSITIPDSVTSIGKEAFGYCTGLKSIRFGDNSKLTSIGKYAFYNCKSLTSITIPDSVTSIGEDAFQYCTSLTSITIPNSVTSIGGWAFSHCSSLTSISFGENSKLTSIGWHAFYGCTSLTSITIPDSVTSIGAYAFRFCTSLTSITIPDSVTSIGSSAFSGCTGLTSITVEKGNTVYHSAGNCLIETASKTLIAGCKNSIIPTDGSVTSIGDDAFWYCTVLTSITIPDSVTSIGKEAFYNCKSLTSIRFGGTKAQWENVSKGTDWNKNTPAITVKCTDGNITVKYS